MRALSWKTTAVDPAAGWIALAALAAYVPGLWWGLPYATSDVGKHGWDVDGIGGILTLSELHNLFVVAKPDWYVAYPPFHYLLLGVVYLPYLGWLWLTGGLSNPSSDYPYGFADPVGAVAALALLSRIVTVVMAAGTVVAAYFTGRLVWDRATGIVAAVAVMLAHPMFYYSRTSNLDVPVMFWLALSFWMAAKILAEGATNRHAAWLGSFIALAVATKDQAYGPWVLGCGVLPALSYYRARLEGSPWSWRPWIAVAVSAAGVYAISGGLLLSPHRFAAHLRFLADFKQASPIVQQLPEIFRPLTLDGLVALASENVEATAEAMGPILPLVALAGLAFARRSAFLLLIASALLGYIVFVLLPVQHVQYRYLMFPVYALAFPAARALTWSIRRPRPVGLLALVLCLAVGAHLSLRGIDLTYQMLFDARREAASWLADRAGPGTRLAYFGLVDQLPPIPRGTEVVQTSAEAPVEIQWSPAWPDLVFVIPDFSSAPGMAHSRFLPGSVYARLRDGSLGYAEVARFRTKPLFDPMPKYLPYVNSAVEIYARIQVSGKPGAASPNR